MSHRVRSLGIVLGLTSTLGTAHAQEPTEVLEPGGQTLPPLEGSEAADGTPTAPGSTPTGDPVTETRTDAPRTPGSELPGDPPIAPGPSGALGDGPSEETNGLIAILSTDVTLSGTVKVLLKGADGTTELLLNDQGEAPDVTADDGLWEGLAPSAPLDASVELVVNGETRSGGRVSWEPNARPRELKIRLMGDTVAVTAATGTGGAKEGGEASAPKETRSEGVPSVSKPSAPAPTQATASAGGVDWMGALALVLALAALGMGMLRKSAPPAVEPQRPPAPPKLPARVREAGVLGSGTPSLSDGLSVWVGPDAVLGALLSTLAHRRPVVVVTAPEHRLPPVVGGAVFQVASLQPDSARAAAEAVLARGGLGVCMVFLPGAPIDGGVLELARRALPEGVGGVVFGPSSTADAPTVELGPAPGGVAVTVGGRPVRRVEVGPRGFQLQ